MNFLPGTPGFLKYFHVDVGMCVCWCARARVCVHAWVCARVGVCVCVCVWVCVHTPPWVIKNHLRELKPINSGAVLMLHTPLIKYMNLNSLVSNYLP